MNKDERNLIRLALRTAGDPSYTFNDRKYMVFGIERAGVWLDVSEECDAHLMKIRHMLHNLVYERGV